jgi:MerR family transcriptional regulator, copper efflux regulator
VLEQIVESGTLLVDVPALRIGQVAEASGLSVKTVRFYCDEGLIATVSRTQGGYRLFHPAVLDELALIRSMRAMDVPLPELKRILDVRRSGFCNCSALKKSIQDRIESINARMVELDLMRNELSGLLGSWKDCGGVKPS